MSTSMEQPPREETTVSTLGDRPANELKGTVIEQPVAEAPADAAPTEGETP